MVGDRRCGHMVWRGIVEGGRTGWLKCVDGVVEKGIGVTLVGE